MPNWCTTTVVIAGARDALEELRAQLAGPSQIERLPIDDAVEGFDEAVAAARRRVWCARNAIEERALPLAVFADAEIEEPTNRQVPFSFQHLDPVSPKTLLDDREKRRVDPDHRDPRLHARLRDDRVESRTLRAEDHGVDAIAFSFDTAWGPPQNVLEALAGSLRPDLEMVAWWLREDDALAGMLAAESGIAPRRIEREDLDEWLIVDDEGGGDDEDEGATPLLDIARLLADLMREVSAPPRASRAVEVHRRLAPTY